MQEELQKVGQAHFTIGTPATGGAIKVYVDFNDMEKTEDFINKAVLLNQKVKIRK